LDKYVVNDLVQTHYAIQLIASLDLSHSV